MIWHQTTIFFHFHGKIAQLGSELFSILWKLELLQTFKRGEIRKFFNPHVKFSNWNSGTYRNTLSTQIWTILLCMWKIRLFRPLGFYVKLILVDLNSQIFPLSHFSSISLYSETSRFLDFYLKLHQKEQNTNIFEGLILTKINFDTSNLVRFQFYTLRS